MANFVYHVTNVEVTRKRKKPKIDWKCIEVKEITDPDYHPKLPGPNDQIKCSFFTCTLDKNEFPEESPYPKSGFEGRHYIRIGIPFKNIYERYPTCWFWCAINKQAHYICGKEEHEKEIEKAILRGYAVKGLNKKMILNDYLKKNKNIIEGNEFLDKDETEKEKENWKIFNKVSTEKVLEKIQNDFSDNKVYNLVVCKEDVPIDGSAVDTVVCRNGKGAIKRPDKSASKNVTDHKKSKL